MNKQNGDDACSFESLMEKQVRENGITLNRLSQSNNRVNWYPNLGREEAVNQPISTPPPHSTHPAPKESIPPSHRHRSDSRTRDISFPKKPLRLFQTRYSTRPRKPLQNAIQDSAVPVEKSGDGAFFFSFLYFCSATTSTYGTST